ncbi:ferredoxin-type protein NapF [Pectobacterium aroidearum]|uniref:ferredoxin-type protein NapF n=1 Tax=Pectobacterium aroidearum TaxID=1201031 RepID=UPI0030196A02
MSKTEMYYKELMSHRHVSRRALFRAFITAVRHTVPATLPAHSLPPGILSDEHFRTQCTRCDACIDACSMGILSKNEDGFPQLRIEYASCDGCGLCINVCSEGALRPLTRFDTGLRPVFSQLCVSSVWACKQCVDVCQEQACLIGEGGLPQVDYERCNGCGECLVQCGHSAITLEIFFK